MIYKAIIVEDEQEVAHLIGQYLMNRKPSTLGNRYQLMGIAKNITSAKALVEVMDVDLLLLDVYLPDGTGLELLAQLRAKHHQGEAMFLTAAREMNILERGMQLGVCDFLIKPIMLDRLDQALQRFELRQQQLANASELTQGVADALFAVQPGNTRNRERLPKGVDTLTRDKVLALFNDDPTLQATAQNIGDQLGISRSTARRYLEYLADSGHLIAEQKYGAVGRPERCYHLKPLS
jgi:two-component system, CitB family, response regulator